MTERHAHSDRTQTIRAFRCVQQSLVYSYCAHSVLQHGVSASPSVGALSVSVGITLQRVSLCVNVNERTRFSSPLRPILFTPLASWLQVPLRRSVFFRMTVTVSEQFC